MEDFGAVLRAAFNKNNRLTDMLTFAWDYADLRSYARRSKRLVSHAHIGLLGLVSDKELSKLWDPNYACGKLCSQVLWVSVRNPRPLWAVKPVSGALLRRLSKQLMSAARFARRTPYLTLSPESEEHWPDMYADLAQPAPGILGILTRKAPEQVLRIGALYSILDESPLVLPVHLRAARAVWRLCEASARQSFEETLDGYDSRVLLMALGAGPKTYDELLNVMHGKRSPHTLDITKRLLDSTLRDLYGQGLVSFEKDVHRLKKGQPTGSWAIAFGWSLETVFRRDRS